MVVDPTMLEAVVRGHLNAAAPRTMIVLEPLRINVTNFVQGLSYDIDVPNFPDDPSRGYHKIAFGNPLFIEQTDFKVEADKSYRRLTPNQSVGLRYAGYVMTVKQVHKDSTGKVREIDVECETVDAAKEKPKAFIHWVSDPMTVEVRLYERLFKHKNPEDPTEVPGGFLSDVDSDSKKVLQSFADKSMRHVKVLDRFQFERIGFFAVDSDSTADMIVFNRTVSLKDDAKKT